MSEASGNEAGLEFTPIVVHGLLYVAAFHYVTALDLDTGAEVWRYDLKEGPPARRPSEASHIGPAIAPIRHD